jgi:hypothetical protein
MAHYSLDSGRMVRIPIDLEARDVLRFEVLYLEGCLVLVWILALQRSLVVTCGRLARMVVYLDGLNALGLCEAGISLRKRLNHASGRRI